MTPEVQCSDVSAVVGEQLVGSAPEAVAWVALEQNGPWGPKAFTDSHLDVDLGRRIESLAAEHRARPALIRRTGRHADEPANGDPRMVLVGHTDPSNTWLLEGLLSTPEDLLGLDWAALERGDQEAVRRSVPSTVHSDRTHLLVCTNGTRDLCCATKGRPIALGVAAREPERVWETTHTSGHRFAPTTVLLPTGHLHGRLDVQSATHLLRAADRGRTVLAGSRGRSTWPAPAQVAELAVREETGEMGLAAVWVASHEQTSEYTWTAQVAHDDGRRWQVVVESVETDVERAESCGKNLKPLRRWTATRPVE
jgi:hypothetical protein